MRVCNTRHGERYLIPCALRVVLEVIEVIKLFFVRIFFFRAKKKTGKFSDLGF